MIELYLSKVTETTESEQAGKLYARVSYKQTLSVQDMAHHMAEHNTMFSEGSITGILIDFVKCVREQVLMGNTVKIDNLAIFKATVEANALLWRRCTTPSRTRWPRLPSASWPRARRPVLP